MGNSILIAEPPAEAFDLGYTLDPHGIVVTRELTDEEWRALGAIIVRRHEGATWALGDWLVLGGRHEKTGPHDTPYAEAIMITGYSREYLAKAYTVAKRFPRGTRVVGANWAMHYAVMGLVFNAAVALLETARDEHWTADRLSIEIQHLAAAQAAADQRRIDYTEALRASATPRSKHFARATPPQVQCPTCKARFTIRGHRVKRQT
jgi:hypothetical protein